MLLPLASRLRGAICLTTSLADLLVQEGLLCRVLSLAHLELLLESLQALCLVLELASPQFELVDEDDEERQEYHEEDSPDCH